VRALVDIIAELVVFDDATAWGLDCDLLVHGAVSLRLLQVGSNA
jgi:hypothetical protein